MRRLRSTGITLCGVAWLGVSLGGCVAADSPILDSAVGCEAYVPGQPVPDDLAVSDTVRTFMQASADLTGLGEEIGQEVLAACAGIAVDLGAEDTWSDADGLDVAISNPERTGACDAATDRIVEVLAEAREVNAEVALLVTRGECHVDFEAQAACDQACADSAECEPGTVETRCEPGELSVECHASCEADATCVGTAEVAANCMGQCEAECVGECQGSCIAADGTVTENDPNCVGKCTSTCNGECRGRCKIEAEGGIECGAEVACEGGCTGSYSDPVCTSEYTEPECQVDPDCHAACTAQALAEATCDPPRVELFADVTATPELQPLVDTLEANLPALFEAAEARGPLARSALERLSDSGTRLAEDLGDLEGVELACLGAAATSVVQVFSVFDVAFQASLDVTVTTTEECR